MSGVKKIIKFTSLEERRNELERLAKKYPNAAVMITYNDSDRDCPHMYSLPMSEVPDIPVSDEYFIDIMDCDIGFSAIFIGMSGHIWESKP